MVRLSSGDKVGFLFLNKRMGIFFCNVLWVYCMFSVVFLCSSVIIL